MNNSPGIQDYLDNEVLADFNDQNEIISIDFVVSDDEIIETYDLREDGTLIQVANDPQLKKLTRKRKRNPKNWKRNISKKNRQSGKAYVTNKGKIIPARSVKSIGCFNPVQCQFQCMTRLNHDARQAIFDSYWNLNDSEKRHFYVANVKRANCKRKRTLADRSQKSNNFNYYFNYMNEDIQVCQQFFVNTLNVNKGRVYYYFAQNKNKSTITPAASRHGKHQKKVIPESKKQEIRDHIKRFPVVESHYCRQNSKKKYLYQGLNLATMYRLFLEEADQPPKLWVYRDIFNYEFNLSFFCPKKDRCDKCLAFELLTDPTEQQVNDQNHHLMRKLNASYERNKDREINLNQTRRADAGFDMENVFQLPMSNASCCYYRRKFSVLNLTVAINKIIYNAMWNESLCGREGTHIANALIKVLKRIVEDNPLLEYLTLWSDSCIPQNRNSIMSTAIQYFLNSTESNLTKIDQKFSEAGHGQVQEVDSAHSVIERFLRGKMIYSPPSLIEEFEKLPTNKLKFIVVPMEEHDYFDYHLLSNAYKYSVVPYTKIKQLTYEKNQSRIWAKFDFNQEFVEIPIELKPRNIIDVGSITHLTLSPKMSAAKMRDIQNMFHIMPDADKLFYQNIFNSNQLQINIDYDESIPMTVSENNERRQISVVRQKDDRKVSKQKKTKNSPKIMSAETPIVKPKVVHRASKEARIPSIATKALKRTKMVDVTASSPSKRQKISKLITEEVAQNTVPIYDCGSSRTSTRQRKIPTLFESFDLSVSKKKPNETKIKKCIRLG